MTLLDRVFGRAPEAAARALISAATQAAPDLARALGMAGVPGSNDAAARGAALLLAKLCFDRTVPAAGPHHHNSLQASVKASKQLYPAIAFELGGTAADAGRRYVELADAVRRGLESRAPSERGAAVVARELRRVVSPDDSGADVPPALADCVDRLIKQFSAVAARELGVRSAAVEDAVHGR